MYFTGLKIFSHLSHSFVILYTDPQIQTFSKMQIFLFFFLNHDTTELTKDTKSTIHQETYKQ